MKKNTTSKNLLLLDWLLNALDNNLYKGLEWVNREEKIFSIVWTHKSAEQWSKGDIEPFTAWAEFKGKQNRKNEKQLKATFRCALNSKNELEELKSLRDRGIRYWQFVDPASRKKEIKKNRKTSSGRVNDVATTSSDSSMGNVCSFEISALRLGSSSEDILTAPKLPNFQSFGSFASLTPPHQANEVSFTFLEPGMSQKKHNDKKNNILNCDLLDSVTSNVAINDFAKSLSPVGNNIQAKNSTNATLPPFETLCSFVSITPPPQKNEICLNLTDCRTSFSPSPNPSNLTPPFKTAQNNSQFNTFHQASSDVWQPNGWTTSLAHQDFNSFSQFLSNHSDELYTSTTYESHSRMDFQEMDQSVPVMDISQNLQPINKNRQCSTTNKMVSENNLRLDDDYLLHDPAWERLMQELDRLTPPLENGVFSYSS